MVVYLKLFFKHFMIARELNDTVKSEEILNRILNESHWLY